MKPEIHPEYNMVKATCSCGNVIEVGSTLSEDIHLDVCSKCHPFYTGKQKIIDSGGRVERFRKRFGNRSRVAPTDAGAEDTGAEDTAGEENAAQADVAQDDSAQEDASSKDAPTKDAPTEDAPTEDAGPKTK